MDSEHQVMSIELESDTYVTRAEAMAYYAKSAARLRMEDWNDPAQADDRRRERNRRKRERRRKRGKR